MKKQILIIGSLNMDIVVGMKRMPLPGETVLGNSISYVPGGKGANQAFAAGKLGGKAVMLGCVGADETGSRLIGNLGESGTDIGYIAQIDGVPSGTAPIFVDGQGNNSIVVVAGANACCNTAYLMKNESLIRESDYVIFQMEIPEDAVFYGIQKAAEYGKTVILNPAPAPDELPEDIFQWIDYFTPNETELLKLGGLKELTEENVRLAAHRFVQRGIKNVIVTMGDKDVLLVNSEREQSFPARKVEAVDTTAAGDCFNGALAVGLSEGMDLDHAIRFANTASSIAVTRKGAQSSIPDRAEVDSLFMS